MPETDLFVVVVAAAGNAISSPSASVAADGDEATPIEPARQLDTTSIRYANRRPQWPKSMLKNGLIVTEQIPVAVVVAFDLHSLGRVHAMSQWQKA